MSAKNYRDNVCAVIRRVTDNSVCVFHRKGFHESKGWQFPQGGVDSQKDLISELKRELLEEIGTDAVVVITISPHTYYYNFPENITPRYKNYTGQKQRWILVELQQDESVISFNGIDAEFDAYQWVTPKEAVHQIVGFKKDVYQRALSDLKLL